MASVDGDGLRDQHMSSRRRETTSSESGRPPMWDSSDPDRAPPPLPLNPSLPGVSPTKHNTSAVVAAAAQALVEKARERTGSPSPYNSSYWNEKSKTPQHRRLQSLQNVSIKDFGRALESRQSNENGLHRTLSKSSSAMPTRDIFTSPPEISESRSGTPTPTNPGVESGPDHTSRATRPQPRPLFGENTPPSSTVLALQNIQLRGYDAPLGDVTNYSTRSPQTVDSIYSQMQNLTAIATTLQKEMAALSRRSKDNATDLISLKEATQSRDEDIRKSLREIVNSVRASDANLLQIPRIELPRPNSAMAYLDNQSFSTPSHARTISLPKIPSVHNFDFSPESPRSVVSHYDLGTAASVAMLEKIIREMGTKEGQERVLSQLSSALTSAGRESADVAFKVGQVLEIVREKPGSQALIRHPEQRPGPSRNNSCIGTESGSRRNSETNSSPVESALINGEFLKVLQKVKDSVAHNGGMNEEVKSLITELRDEVLGMGRELGRKLEKAESSDALSETREELSREDLMRIVSEGLAELRGQMVDVIQAKRRQSGSSVLSRSAVDSNEIYNAMKQALADQGFEQSQALQVQNAAIDRESILTAVKEAYEAYKPEIELQQFGLERDEILQCLKEGLVDYQSSKSAADAKSIDRDDVMDAVQEALQHFSPPKPTTEAAELKEEILLTVRESLEQFLPQSREVSFPHASEITRDNLVEAVRDGFASSNNDRGVDITQDDIYEAVKAGLAGQQSFSEQTLNSLKQTVEGLHTRLDQLPIPDANDAEQILTALKNGLMNLRTDIEACVDRSQDMTGKEELMQTIKDELHDLRGHVEAVVTRDNHRQDGPGMLELIDTMKHQFENIHDALSSRSAESGINNSHEEILLALSTGFSNLLEDRDGRRGTDGLSEETQDMLKSELDQLRGSVLDCTVKQKDEILESIQDGIETIHSRLASAQNTTANTDEVIAVIKEELQSVKDSLMAPVLHPGPSNSTEEVLDAVKSSLDEIRTQILGEQDEANSETLGLIKEELKDLRKTLGSSLTLANSGPDKTEILEAIQAGMNSGRDQSARDASDSEQTQAIHGIREELEHLREVIATALIKTGAHTDTDDVLTELRTGLDDLRVCIEQKVEPPQSPAARSDEMLSTLNEILDSLRKDIEKVADRSADVALSEEILDTLKDGMEDLRSGIDQLKEVNEKVRDEALVLATASTDRDAESEDPENAPSRKADLQKLEVQLAQLQIKVEALGLDFRSTMSEPTASKADVDGITALLGEVQGAIALLVADRGSNFANAASKEDTDALETLMQNTKAMIDEAIIPALNATVTKEDLDSINVSLRMTNDSVDNLSGLAELLQQAKSQADEGGTITKTDFDIVSEACKDILGRLTDLPSAVPSKDNVDHLTELLQDFRKSHESQKEQYEKDISVTSRAFDDRKAEFKLITEHLQELKTAVEESKEDLRSKMKDGNLELKTLDQMLQGIERKIEESPTAVPDVKSLKELITKEFSEAQARLEVIKTEQDHASKTIIDKQDELRSIVFAEILNRLDDRLDGITKMTEEQHEAAKKITREAAARAVGHEEILDRSNTIVEDLKLTIDTLGATVTGISPALMEATEKVSNDSKTVYNRVEDIYAKLEEGDVDSKTEHQLTRKEIQNALTAIGTLRESASEFQPRVMDTLVNLATMLEKHLDHARPASDIPLLQMAPGGLQDDDLHRKLDELLARDMPATFDTADIHKKLDELAASQGPPDVTIDLDGIEDIQQQISTSAADIAAFLQFQTKLLTAQHDNKEREVQEAAVELARYNAEKTSLELAVSELQDVKHGLRSDIASLHSEKEMLAAQKSRLATEVSSLETALVIRREELQMMDVRADQLERRIIEGVMDHSKALLMTKAAKTPAHMNLKRVSSNASSVATVTSVTSGIANAGVDMALKLQPALRSNSAKGSPAERRILSLGQITSNVPRGGSALSIAPSRKAFASQMKRSQSVKQVATRKASWAGQESIAEHDKENDSHSDDSDIDVGTHDGTTSSIDFASRPTTRSQLSRTNTSKTGTDRRSSYGTGESDYTYTTGSYLSGSDVSRRTTSYGSTIRSTVGARSSVADEHDDNNEENQASASDYDEHQSADDMRRPELRQLDGTHDGKILLTAPIAEEDMSSEDDQTQHSTDEHQATDVVLHRPGYDSGLGPEMQVALPEVLNKHDAGDNDDKDMRRGGYDSGLGSDLPTAALSSLNGSDYFKDTL